MNRRIVYIVGPSGSGKSHLAREILEHECGADYFIKSPCNKWFDGYDGQTGALFDDFRGSWLKYSMLLNVADPAGYPVRCEVKGGTVLWRPTLLVITSNLFPLRLYSNHSDSAALLRRVKNANGCVYYLASRGARLREINPEGASTVDSDGNVIRWEPAEMAAHNG